MKESISVFLKRLSDILEFVISFILTAGIILLCLRVAGAIYKIPDLNVWPNFENCLWGVRVHHFNKLDTDDQIEASFQKIFVVRPDI